MPSLEHNRTFFKEVFSDTQSRFNQNEFLDVVCEWMNKNMQAHEVFNHMTDKYQEGYIDGYDEGKNEREAHE